MFEEFGGYSVFVEVQRSKVSILFEVGKGNIQLLFVGFFMCGGFFKHG